MGSLPRGNIHGLLNAAKFSNGTIVNLMKYRLKDFLNFIFIKRSKNQVYFHFIVWKKKGK